MNYSIRVHRSPLTSQNRRDITARLSSTSSPVTCIGSYCIAILTKEKHHSRDTVMIVIYIGTGTDQHLNWLRSSSDGKPGVFDGSVITCFLLCVRNFPIEHVRFLDTCSNMAAINNKFGYSHSWTNLCLTIAMMNFFVLYKTNQYKDF